MPTAKYGRGRSLYLSLSEEAIPGMVEVNANTVKGLLDTKFISKAKENEWLSNFVLVKKALRNWRINVYYICPNRVCSKDFYPLPNIYMLIDN